MRYQPSIVRGGDNETGLTMQNGCVVSRTFDDANLLTTITNKNGSNVALSSFAYSYNNDNTRADCTESNGDVVSWRYDALHRLTSEARTGSHSYSNSYTLDGVGNRTSQTVGGSTTSFSYNPVPRQCGIVHSGRGGTWRAGGSSDRRHPARDGRCAQCAPAVETSAQSTPRGPAMTTMRPDPVAELISILREQLARKDEQIATLQALLMDYVQRDRQAATAQAAVVSTPAPRPAPRLPAQPAAPATRVPLPLSRTGAPRPKPAMSAAMEDDVVRIAALRLVAAEKQAEENARSLVASRVAQVRDPERTDSFTPVELAAARARGPVLRAPLAAKA